MTRKEVEAELEVMKLERETYFDIEIAFSVEHPIKPCPRPRMGRNVWVPEHGAEELEAEIVTRICEKKRLPRGLRYDAVIGILPPRRGDIDNRIKTLLDVLSKVTAQDDSKIKLVQVLVTRRVTKNLIVLGRIRE